MNQGTSKVILTHWVSLGLKRALSNDNIRQGFKAIGILPLNKEVVDRWMGPSEPFGKGRPSGESGLRSTSAASAENGEAECTSERADYAQGLGDEPEERVQHYARVAAM
jgi:hypothetical protein